MSEIKEKHSNISERKQCESKECLMTGRSLQSVQANNFKTIAISPWSGDDYYTKIRKQIQDQKPRKRSQTAKSMKSRLNEFSINPQHNKINTVQLELTPISMEILKNKWKHVQSKLSTQYFREDHSNQRQIDKLKKQHCSTLLLKEVETIHKKQSSTKIIKPRVERLHSEILRSSNAASSKNSISDKKDKKCLLFFFETKNKSSIVNREKMIMKIRNIEKGKALRIYTQKI